MKQKKILIIEDTPENVALIKMGLMQTFEGESLILRVSDKIQKAKGILEQEQDHFDLIILDYNLPDGCGKDLIPLIRKTQQSCVIAASSNIKEYNLEMKKVGVNIITEKDFANDEFADIRNQLQELVLTAQQMSETSV